MTVGAPLYRSDRFTLWLESRRVRCRVRVGDSRGSLDIVPCIFDDRVGWKIIDESSDSDERVGGGGTGFQDCVAVRLLYAGLLLL